MVQDSLCPQLVFQDGRLPLLPDDVLLMIAREYCLATVEDRALDGWWTVNAEMQQLSRCPKRKQIINVKGFWIPRFGNQLEPVTGYFWWRLIRAVFGHDDYLHCTQLDILQTRRCTFQRQRYT